MDKVSAIIPAWGETPFLERAVSSVRRQTLGDVECIVVAQPEDGPRTAAAARRSGVERAKGDWISFCDADDWMEPDALSKMLAEAEREGADCVCCGMVREFADGRSIRKPYEKDGPGDTCNALVNKIFRRELLEGLTLDDSIVFGEDLMVTAQALAKAKKIAVTDDAFYHYCENPASVTHRLDGRKRVLDLVRVGEILRSALPGPEYSRFHDSVARDALLLWIRYRLFDRRLWRLVRSRMAGPLLGDSRHGFLKKGALACAACIFD